jgi:hypothetical protein
LEKAGIAVLILLLVALPIALHGWPASLAGNVAVASLLASGLTLVWWRTRPRLVAVLGGSLWFAVALLSQDAWFPEAALAIMAGLAAAAALAWTGRAAWLAALSLGVYLYVFWLVLPPTSPVAVVMFSVPGFLAGTVLRLRVSCSRRSRCSTSGPALPVNCTTSSATRSASWSSRPPRDSVSSATTRPGLSRPSPP